MIQTHSFIAFYIICLTITKHTHIFGLTSTKIICLSKQECIFKYLQLFGERLMRNFLHHNFQLISTIQFATDRCSYTLR